MRSTIVVLALWSMPGSVDRRARTFATLAAGFGGFTILFLLLVFLVPHVLKEGGRGDQGRRWQRSALRASPPALLMTVLWTLTSLPIDPLGVRLAVAAFVAVILFVT